MLKFKVITSFLFHTHIPISSFPICNPKPKLSPIDPHTFLKFLLPNCRFEGEKLNIQPTILLEPNFFLSIAGMLWNLVPQEKVSQVTDKEIPILIWNRNCCNWQEFRNSDSSLPKKLQSNPLHLKYTKIPLSNKKQNIIENMLPSSKRSQKQQKRPKPQPHHDKHHNRTY